jgi:gamma-glutamyltranspeptidase/glutathione hydrolase
VTPLEAGFAGRRVVELPPPTQGVTALEMLRIADAVAEVATLGDGVERTHLLIEIARLALADRDAYVADPDHMPLAAERLLDDEWIAARASRVDRARTQPMVPRRPGADGDTAYLCCADADGLLVSLIQSNFTSIGSGLHVPQWGINLHNRGASFSLDPARVNALAPGKLPLHTLIPALVLGADDTGAAGPTHVVGTMGGHAQAQVHLQLLVRLLVDQDDPGAAIDAPRWQVEPSSGLVSIEARVPADWRAELERRGHDLHVLRAYDDGVGHAHCIEVAEHGYVVAGDPRAESLAIGV